LRIGVIDVMETLLPERYGGFRTMEEDLFMNAPAELQYLLQCCEAVTEERYEEAILLFHQGLLENQKEPDQIKTSDLLPLLHALFREIELSLGPNIAIKWRKLWEQTHKAEKLVEPTCSFCIKNWTLAKTGGPNPRF
jgi:hypothetical protein